MKKLTLKLPGPNQTKLTLFREDGWHLTVKRTYDPLTLLKCPQLIWDTWIRIWKCWFSRKSKRWVPGEKPLWAENSLRNRHSEGKVKGTSDAREAQSAWDGGGNLSSLLPRARIPFPFPFEPLLIRLSRRENPKQTQPTYSVPTRTRTRWQASAPTTAPRLLLPLSTLTNRKFRSCSFLRVSLSLAISSTFLWRNPNKKKNIFVLAAAQLKLFKTTRNKSFCLFADLFFLFRARVRKLKPRRVYKPLVQGGGVGERRKKI